MPIVRAILAHLYMAWIHPFGDGNGRTARLLEFAILVRAGIPTPAAHLLSNHYNETRAEYYRQLAHASAARTVMPFLRYALQGFVDGLRAQIQEVRKQTLDDVWTNYVHDSFREKEASSTTARRRKHLVLDLHRSDALPARAIRLLSPRLAEAYATKTHRTVERDLDALKKMGLVIEDGGKFRANVELVRAFLPRMASPDSPPRSTGSVG